MPGISVLTLEGNPFTIKYQIQKGEQPELGFVIYSPEAMPKDEDNWLLDYQEEGVLFSADMSSLYAAECGIAMELKDAVVQQHINFFKKTDNRNKLAARLHPGMDTREIEKMILAVVCKSKTTCEAYTYALITEMVQEETTLQADMKSYNLEDIYWDEVKTTFGYQENRNIKDLLIVLFQNDLKKKLTNEALIFMRDWRDSRTYVEMYQELAGQLENELNIRETIQEYSLQQLLEVETYPCIDKIISSYLANDVLNGSITVEELEAIIEERENKLFLGSSPYTPCPPGSTPTLCRYRIEDERTGHQFSRRRFYGLRQKPIYHRPALPPFHPRSQSG